MKTNKAKLNQNQTRMVPILHNSLWPMIMFMGHGFIPLCPLQPKPNSSNFFALVQTRPEIWSKKKSRTGMITKRTILPV